jgi:glucose/mannose transport system substrate-binding protein
MKKFAVVAAMATALLGSTAVNAADVEVIHWWTSGGEQAAVSVFAREFDALGEDKWVDTAIAGGENARSATLQRTLGGDPPGAAQFNISRQFEELAEAGLLLDLTPLAEEEGWKDFIRPAAILDVCEFEGKIYCVPVNIHSWQWAWASVPAFEKAGVPLPKNLDEFIAEAPKLQEAGIIPFAIGGEAWQIGGAMGVVMLSQLGKAGHEAIYKDRNLEVAGGPEVLNAIKIFKSLKTFTDEGSANRTWNDTTNLVIQDQAALQIMGDWARGEFAVAGEQPGTDYACIAGPSEHPYLDTGGDIFLFPKQEDAAVEAAQLKMASMMVNPQVQALFNNAKGSLPVRDDVDMSLADDCMKAGLEILKNPDSVIQGAGIYLTQDSIGQMDDLWAEAWANPDLTAEEIQQRFVDIIASAE